MYVSDELAFSHTMACILYLFGSNRIFQEQNASDIMILIPFFPIFSRQQWEIQRANIASRAPKAPALSSPGNRSHVHGSSTRPKMTLCRPTRGGRVPRWAQGTRPGVLAVAVCPLPKADRLTPRGTVTTSQRGHGAARATAAGIDRLDLVRGGGICRMSTKTTHTGPILMGAL